MFRLIVTLRNLLSLSSHQHYRRAVLHSIEPARMGESAMEAALYKWIDEKWIGPCTGVVGEEFIGFCMCIAGLQQLAQLKSVWITVAHLAACCVLMQTRVHERAAAGLCLISQPMLQVKVDLSSSLISILHPGSFQRSPFALCSSALWACSHGASSAGRRPSRNPSSGPQLRLLRGTPKTQSQWLNE